MLEFLQMASPLIRLYLHIQYKLCLCCGQQNTRNTQRAHRAPCWQLWIKPREDLSAQRKLPINLAAPQSSLTRPHIS